MNPEEHSIKNNSPGFRDIILDEQIFKKNIKHPGLTSGAQEIHPLAAELSKRFNAFSYKHQMRYLWVSFVGGTGTGKSTLFNALCGIHLSKTGVERPKTSGPIAYAHRGAPIENSFPISSIQIDRNPAGDDAFRPVGGAPEHLQIFEHTREDRAHLILLDTPDLDSVEAENRQIAEDLCLLSDAVVFVTSQEKYADEVPSQFFRRVIDEKKPYFFLINKIHERVPVEELLITYQKQHISVSKDRIWPIFYVHSNVSQKVYEQSTFQDFSRRLMMELSPAEIDNLRKTGHSKRAEDLKGQFDRLLNLLEEENLACKKWLLQLDKVFEETCTDLIREEKERFTEKSREYLSAEIRGLFARYDVLSRPRRFIRDLFLIPFRFLGLLKEGTEKTHSEGLMKMRRKVDPAPVLRAVEKVNRSVFEKLSPVDESSPLFKKLRQTGMALNNDEVNEIIYEEQDRLATWLEERFQDISKGIPKSKRWGIYSTSIIWGILIISLEASVGGGFTVLDVVLDSALAPFVTKGAVELFAYHEIQKVAKELARHYQEVLLSALNHQRDRYESCLRSLMTSDETFEHLRGLYQQIANWKVQNRTLI